MLPLPALRRWIPRGDFCLHWACKSSRQERSYLRAAISAPTCCIRRESPMPWAREETFPPFLGKFKWNALLSSVARLFVYGSVAAALPALRRKQPHADAFRLPGGVFIAALALLFTGVLVSRMHWGEFLVISITAILAFVNWLWARKQPVRFGSSD